MYFFPLLFTLKMSRIQKGCYFEVNKHSGLLSGDFAQTIPDVTSQTTATVWFFIHTLSICEVMHCDRHRQFSYGIRTLWFCCMSKEQHCSVLVFRLASNRNKSYGTYEIILIYLIVRVKTTWPEVVGYHIKLQLLWSQNGRSAVLVWNFWQVLLQFYDRHYQSPRVKRLVTFHWWLWLDCRLYHRGCYSVFLNCQFDHQSQRSE